jgi:hypothetical protein
MLLKELEPGQRFEFADKNSGFLLYTGERHTARGIFMLVGFAQFGCPVLENEALCSNVVAASNTVHRDVILLFAYKTNL